MKINIVYIAALLTFHATAMMGQVGFEQYYYLQRKATPIMVPIVHFQNRQNWYGEVRYNYEEKNSFSAYAGKHFFRKSELLEYSLTPIIGGVMGQFKGGSIGFNASVEYDDFFFDAQTQLTCSINSDNTNFYFGWYDLGYSPIDWLWFGWSLQHTLYGQVENNITESGIMVGFKAGKWTFPIYTFNVLNTDPYLVLGITHIFGFNNK
jgi:hypothetical protein